VTSYFLVFAANFAFILLKALQQRNVAFDNYVWIVPTSFAMAVVEVYVVAQVAVRGWSIPVVIALGLAGGTGALSAVYLHKRFIKKEIA
jgi:hypothetical protein